MNKPLPPTPFQVLIVAKTRMKHGYCIGAIAQNGRSLRLVAPRQSSTEHFNIDYEIGDVWRIDDYYLPEIELPHAEDIKVRAARRLWESKKLLQAIEKLMPPVIGGVEQLYGGAVHVADNGRLYVGREHVPDHSTLFWRTDRTLILRDTADTKFRYVYPGDEREYTFSYVGLAAAEAYLPANTLVRVSLARWWKPKDEPDQEKRCYLQVSGWFDKPRSGIFPVNGKSYPESLSNARPSFARIPVSVDLPELLHRHFGFREFLPYQKEIILSVLARRDTLVIMSTGAGKSLCYQLPSLAFNGLTVVVSPLISLMQDQVTRLIHLGIPAAALNSQLSEIERERVTRQAQSGELRLLYLSPEMLLRPATASFLQSCQVECLVVDEAHCISQWGHDFREEYGQIESVREHLGDIPILALTATATRQVRNHVVENLNLRDVAEFVAPFDRPNLFLAIQPRQNGDQQLFDFLAKHPNQTGIIYCATRNQVDELTQKLNAAGYTALNYHAGLDNAVRNNHQRRFIHDEVSIMVATIAFGMGIDKPDIRFVLHYNMPNDPESYYQQIGRAGRDGDRADCLMLYSPEDFRLIRYKISKKSSDQRPIAIARLQHMSTWVQHPGCRRKWLINYFDDETAADTCTMCDNCNAIANPQLNGPDDITVFATLFLSCVQQLRENFGLTYVISVLRGSKAKKILRRQHDRLPTYNQGRSLSETKWQVLTRQFLDQKIIVQGAYKVIQLTDAGRQVLNGQPVFGTFTHRQAEVQVSKAPENKDLFERLLALRMELAAERRIAPYMVFSDRTLREMATLLPKNEAELLEIHGVGRYKVVEFGTIFLEALAPYLDIQQPSPSILPQPRRGTTDAVRERRALAFAGLRAGKSLAVVAEEYGVTPVTVLRYLYEHFRDNGQLPAGIALPPAQVGDAERQQVFALFAERGVEALAPIYWALDQSVEYTDLDWLRLEYLQARAEEG